MKLVCFISGSSRGIGLSIAKHLASQGHQVILNSRKPLSDEVLKEFEGYEYPVGQSIGDISDYNQAGQMVEDIIEQYGTIDVLINNAGINKDGLFIRMSEEDFDQVIQTNLKGTFNLSRHITPIMLKKKSGTIINMSSVVGIAGNPGQANYAASKAGIIGLTKSLAKEIGSRSITVNAIAPGYIETDMTDALSDKVKKQMMDLIPLKRFGKVEEVNSVVDFLINNRYVTGQVIEVNGGLHI